MKAVETDLDRLRSEVERASWVMADMIRHLSSTEARVPGSSWTVGDNAAHAALAQRYFADLVAGASSPYLRVDQFEALNNSSLSEFKERNGGRIADLLQKGTATFLEATSGLPQDRLINWHMGQKLKLLPFTSYVLYHLLVHSYEIARALGLPNPVKPAQVVLTIPFFSAVAPFIVDKENASTLQATVQLRLRRGPRINLRFNKGELTVDEDAVGAADCYLSAEPVAFFLVATKLVGRWGPMARGKLFAWGRKPWLALRLTSLLKTP